MKRLLSLLLVLVMASCCYAQPLIMGALNTKIQSGTLAPNGNVFGNATDLYLQRDAGVGKLWLKQTGMGSLTGWTQVTGGGTITAMNNGLSLSGTTGQLGGSRLIKNAIIETDTFKFYIGTDSVATIDSANAYYFYLNPTGDAGNPSASILVSRDSIITEYAQTGTEITLNGIFKNTADTTAKGFIISQTSLAMNNTIGGDLARYTFQAGLYNSGAVPTSELSVFDLLFEWDVNAIQVRQHQQYYQIKPADAEFPQTFALYDTLGYDFKTLYTDDVNFPHKGRMALIDSTYTLQLISAVDDYTLWQANDAGAILKTRLVNDSTQIVQDENTISLLVRDGSTNNSFIADNNGFSFSLTTGKVRVTSTAGGIVFPPHTEAQRNAIPSPAVGETIINTDTNKLNYWNGAAWEIITSAP